MKSDSSFLLAQAFTPGKTEFNNPSKPPSGGFQIIAFRRIIFFEFISLQKLGEGSCSPSRWKPPEGGCSQPIFLLTQA